MRVWLVSNLLDLFFLFFVPFFDSTFYFRLGIRSAATRRQSSGRHHLRHDVLLLFGQVFSYFYFFFLYCLVVIVTKKVGLFFFLGCWLWDDTNSSFSRAVFPGSVFLKSSERQMIWLHNSSSSSAHHRNKLRCNSLHVRHQADPLCTLQLVERGKPGNRKFSFRYQ